MTDEDALLQAVMADPDDDAPRLIYADWLDEHGQCERAEFIRVQIVLALPGLPEERRAALVGREGELLREHGRAWEEGFSGITEWCHYKRGFVHSVRCDAATFLMGLDRLFRGHPIRCLCLHNVGHELSQIVKCPQLARLDCLDLGYQFMGDAGTRQLARCPYLASLISLNLRSNRVQRSGHDLAVSPYLRSLEELILVGNPRIPEAVRATLRRRFGSRVYF